jgi:hypothetical protein
VAVWLLGCCCSAVVATQLSLDAAAEASSAGQATQQLWASVAAGGCIG